MKVTLVTVVKLSTKPHRKLYIYEFILKTITGLKHIYYIYTK